jgi:hypothetical protein
LKATSALPKDIEGIALRAVVGIVDAHDHGAAPPRVAHQLLGAAPVYALEAEIDQIARHGGRAFEAAPLRGLAKQVAQQRTVAADLDFGGSVHNHFDGASALRAATAGKICSSLYGLGVHRPAQETKNRSCTVQS